MMTCMSGYEFPFPELLAIHKIPLLGRWGQLFPIRLRVYMCSRKRLEVWSHISTELQSHTLRSNGFTGLQM